MIVVSHESHDMYNPIFVLINLFGLSLFGVGGSVRW